MKILTISKTRTISNRQSIDANSKIMKMLKLSEKDFEMAMVKNDSRSNYTHT
jgi:hypothetical protein